jgi:hypothetical protein
MYSRTFVLAAAIALAAPQTALAACGDQGGPGYRHNESRKCVGWAEMGRRCGNPPTTHCTAERVADRAADAAAKGAEIQSLMERSHAMKRPPSEPARP